MFSTFRSSCRPSLLDKFADVDAQLNPQIARLTQDLSTQFFVAQQSCSEPSLAALAPPVSELQLLAQEQRMFFHGIRQTAEQFRRADMGSLVDSSSRQASAAMSAAVARGEQVPQQRPGWKLLQFDTGDRGRLVEVKGDLTTATHIVFLVPGMTNELTNVDSGLRPRADSLYAELSKQAKPGEKVAVVMWLGYRSDRLSELYDASSDGHGQAGGVSLRRDVAAIAGTGTKATITVVAHSYGTVVAGEAMNGGLDADQVVVLGSPGMGATNRKDLGSPHVQVFATRTGAHTSAADKVKGGTATVMAATVGSPIVGLGAVAGVANKIPLVNRVSPLRPVTEPNLLSAAYKIGSGSDPVAAAPVLGPDPTNASFGSTVFTSSGSGHSAYFDPGSTGLENVAAIALGRKPKP